MKAHVYLRIAGYGITIDPHPPFIIRRGSHDRMLHFEMNGREFSLDAAASPSSISGVADVSDGPSQSEWRLQTTPWTIRWPAGYTIVISDHPAPPQFELVGEGSSLIYFQGPFRTAPSIDKLVAPGQRKVDTGEGANHFWVTVEYEHVGQLWRQTHFIVSVSARFMAVTAQAPASNENIFHDAAEVATSLHATPRDV